MSEFKDTDDDEKEEESVSTKSSKEPTLDIFGYKVRVNDAQNLAILTLTLGVLGLGINTFYPHLLPFNQNKPVEKKVEDKDKKEEKKEQPSEKLADNVEYPDLRMLDLNQPGDDEFMIADVVDRIYNDKESIIDLNPKKSEDNVSLFGEERKVVRKIPSLKIKKEEGFGLDMSDDLLT